MLILLIYVQTCTTTSFTPATIVILLIKEQSTLKPREVRVNVHIKPHHAIKVFILITYSSRNNSLLNCTKTQ